MQFVLSNWYPAIIKKSMSQEIVISQILIKDNLTLVDELVGALHVSELSLNIKTARWKDIKKDYLQYMVECEEEADGKFFVAYDQQKAIGFIFGFVEVKDNSNFEIGEGNDLYISEGYVNETYRNLGVYGKLNNTFVESYSKQPIRRIIRYTLSNNETMQHWLVNKGFNAVRLVYEKWL